VSEEYFGVGSIPKYSTHKCHGSTSFAMSFEATNAPKPTG